MSDINEIKDYLVKNKVKPSYPRLKVLEYLMKYRSHPTADEVYSQLVSEMPTLSKTTVYNTLNLFVEAKVAIPITIDNNETRYDATVEDHGHFKCSRCRRIYDFAVKPQELDTIELSGFKITNRDVYFKGICPDCLSFKN